MEKAIARANHRQRLSLPQDALTSTDVKAKRLDAILAEVGVTEIDLLLIDVEGHEIPVMKSFDLISARPKIAIIECNAGDREAEATIVNMLKAAGLICYKLANDIVAFREGSLLLPLEAVFHFEHVPTLTGEME
jgi:UDP-3-O-acyl-N-acetylglucosamine deacetylase